MRIAALDKSYDLFLGYSWSSTSQGLSGHLYECIEYYYILKKHMKVGIFICEEMPPDMVEATIRTKYDFTDAEVREMMADIHFFDLPQILRAKNVLLVDGNLSKLRKEKGQYMLVDNLMVFPCSDLTFQNMDNVISFQDNRIYSDCVRARHYVKKILFDKYKKIGPSVENVNMVYTKGVGPRMMDESIYGRLEQQYEGDFIVLTATPIETLLSDRFSFPTMPVENLFEKFSTYIYTPVGKKFDCSPRFTAECKWYGKEVIYHEIDYWDVDTGLFWRKHDIDHDFDSIILRDGDDIVKLVQDVIGG